MERFIRTGADLGINHPLAVGVATIAATGIGAAWFAVRAYELALGADVLWPLGGAALGLAAVAVWLNGGLRHQYRLTRLEWAIAIVGQVAAAVAALLVIKARGDVQWQAGAAGYVSGFLFGLAPGIYIGNRRVRRDPAQGPIGAAQAVDALLGRRRRS